MTRFLLLILVSASAVGLVIDMPTITAATECHVKEISLFASSRNELVFGWERSSMSFIKLTSWLSRYKCVHSVAVGSCRKEKKISFLNERGPHRVDISIILTPSYTKNQKIGHDIKFYCVHSNTQLITLPGSKLNQKIIYMYSLCYFYLPSLGVQCCRLAFGFRGALVTGALVVGALVAGALVTGFPPLPLLLPPR